MSPATLSKEQREELLKALKERFEKNMKRHEGLDWADLQARLVRKSGALWSLSEMERTGGQPDVIGRDKEMDQYVFCDCSAESPQGRRSVCYDHRLAESNDQEHTVCDSHHWWQLRIWITLARFTCAALRWNGVESADKARFEHGLQGTAALRDTQLGSLCEVGSGLGCCQQEQAGHPGRRLGWGYGLPRGCCRGRGSH